MEYSSFYGGRRGASFVIVKKYRTIKPPAEDNKGFNKVIRIDMGLADDAEITTEIRNKWLYEHCMVTCFQQGGAYEVAGYDEYVIIDAYNKNDIDNGKIFRRGYDYTNDMGGAIYVGQIVGPAGMAPHSLLNNYDKVQEMVTEDGLVIPNDGTLITDGNLNTYRKTENSLEVAKSGDDATGDLIPGQYFDESGEHFNDTIDYVACSIKDFESHESTVHIGFKIPYQVSLYTSESVSPYYHRSDLEPDIEGAEKWENWSESDEAGTTEFNNKELIKRTDDLSHPFFSSWDIKIPKGIKGESINGFRVSTVAEEREKNPGWLQNYPGLDDDLNTEEIKKERKILVYDYYNYDRDAGGDPVTLYLGDYNMIDDFRIDDYGTVTIDYSHDDEDIYPNLFKWIKEVRLNEDTGFFEIEYNYDKTRDGEELAKEDTYFSMYLTWLKDMDVAEDGTLTWTFTTPEDNREYPQFIKWITQTKLNAETGKFEIDFNYPTEPAGKKDLDGNDISSQPTHYETSLTWVKDITIDEYGTVHFIYTDQEDTIYKNHFKWIKDITLDETTGLLTVNYNYDKTRDGEELADTDTQYQTYLRYLDNVIIDEDGTIHLEYTHGEEQTFEKYLKAIKSISLDSETGRFEVTYNQETDKDGNLTAYSTDLRWVKEVTVDEDGTITFDYTNGDDTVYNNYFKNIKTISLNNETGHFEIIYNYDTDKNGNPTKYETDLNWVKEILIADDGTITIKNSAKDDIVLDKKIKWIKDVKINTGDTEGTGNQKLSVTYNDNTKEDIGNPINYIIKTVLTDDNHLIVLYSDPVKRNEIVAAGQNYTYDNRNDWYDLGVAKGESGIYIGLNLSTIDHPELVNVNDTINYLNTNYPSGLKGSELAGKIVTVGAAADYKLFYAFDYSLDENKNYKGWYYLGSIGGTTQSIVGKEGDSSTEALATQLPTNGLWFVVED